VTTTASEPLEVRAAPPGRDGGRPRRSNAVRVLVVVCVIVAAIAVLMTALNQSTTYFKTADEAVRDKASLGTRRFRVEGVVTAPVVERDGDVRFQIAASGACVAVRHTGDPPELFKPGIPVVLEGRWEGDVYASDRIMIRHTSEYRAKNASRIDQARRDADVTATCPPA
jgi:cytochrome c-type biogenesis protein CcmE